MKRLLFLLLFLSPLMIKAQKEGLENIDSLVRVLPTAGDDSDKVKILATIAYTYWGFDPSKGIKYGNEALRLAEKLDWKPGIAGSNTALAMNYRSKGEYQQALTYYRRSLEVWQELGNKKRIAQGYFMLSMTYIDQSDYPTALDNALLALRISEELRDSANISRTLTNIGIIYDDIGNFDKALEYHMRALKVEEQLHHNVGIMTALSNIGLVYKEKRNYDLSIQTLLAGLKLSDATPYRNRRAVLLGYLGDVYKETGAYSLALRYLNEAKVINEEIGDVKGEALCYQTIGLTYLHAAIDSAKRTDPLLKTPKQQILISAIQALAKSAEMHAAIGNIKDLSENHRDLATANQLAGNYKEALEHHIRYMTFNDSFSNTVKSKQLHELETKYETRQKDVQISDQKRQIAYNRKINLSLALCSALFLFLGILIFVNQRRTNRLNKLITLQKTELEKLNGVKDRIFSVISHDLRTPVNSLVSFTQLLDNGNIPPEKMQRYADVLKTNLGYTAGLMENLLNWARTQMHGYKPVLERFDVSGNIAETAGLLMPEAAKKGIQLTTDAPAGTIVFGDINMTSLLVRNLLANAIKYTPQGGSVSVSAQRTGDKVLISVKDNGVGIPGPLVAEFNSSGSEQPLESTPGTNKEKGTGLGLMLCKGFAALMNGTIVLQSTLGAGSCFTVELPA